MNFLRAASIAFFTIHIFWGARAEVETFTLAETLADEKKTVIAHIYQEGSGTSFRKNKLVKLKVVVEKSRSKFQALSLKSVAFRMPGHGHGMLTKPVIKQLTHAQYLVEGVKLHMPGKWLIELRLQDAANHSVLLKKTVNVN